jgi:hypothetical protein
MTPPRNAEDWQIGIHMNDLNTHTALLQTTSPHDEPDDAAAFLVAFNSLLKKQFPTLSEAAQAAENRMQELEDVTRTPRTADEDVELCFLANFLEKHRDDYGCAAQLEAQRAYLH